MNRKILTLDELAARTRVPKHTLRYWRQHGQGPRTFKLGGRIVAFEDDCEKWISDQYEADQAS